MLPPQAFHATKMRPVRLVSGGSSWETREGAAWLGLGLEGAVAAPVWPGSLVLPADPSASPARDAGAWRSASAGGLPAFSRLWWGGGGGEDEKPRPRVLDPDVTRRSYSAQAAHIASKVSRSCEVEVEEAQASRSSAAAARNMRLFISL